VYRKRDNAKIHRVVHDALQNAYVLGALYVDTDLWIELFELGEDLGKNVEAGTFVSCHDDFAARHVLHLRERVDDGPPLLQGVIDVFEECFAGSRLAPTSSSSARICAEIAGWVRNRFSAAREKLILRATSKKVSS
jgi:hypothetical protein